MEKFNLILLIGSNPLPNVVTALVFKEYVNQIVLIYSEDKREISQFGTKELAENCEKVIQEKTGFANFQYYGLSDVSSASAIEYDLSKLSLDKSTPIHLHYTGGTKAMSVHAYRYFEKNFNDAFEASYLDARNFKLLKDYEDHFDRSDLRFNVQLNIENLLRLHNYEIIPNCNYQLKPFESFQNATNKLIEWISNGNIDDNFLYVIEHYIRKIYKGPDKLLKKSKKFGEHADSSQTSQEINHFNDFLKDNQLLVDFLSKLEGYNILDENREVWIPDKSISNKEFENRIKPAIDYLDGKWLEAVIADKIIEWVNGKGLPESSWGFSLEARKSDQANQRNFELDAFVILGYQLIGISITTDKGGHTKTKAFEIAHRVRQIGGDEAKAILVTGYKQDDIDPKTGIAKTQTLENDIAQFTGTSSGQVKVLGQEEWLNIGNILEGIYRNQL